MNQVDQNNRINGTKLIVKIIKLVPRIGSIFLNTRRALKVKNESELSIGKILEKNALKFKNHNALMYQDVILTHSQFNEVVNQYANYFLSLNIEHGEVVAVYLENRPEMIYVVGALSKIGAVASLINPNQREEVLANSIHIDNYRHIVIGEELYVYAKKVLSKNSLNHLQIHWIKDQGENSCPDECNDLTEGLEKYPKSNPLTTNSIKAQDRFANIFTSGTTGMPKAAIQTHRRWMQLYYWFGKVNLNLSNKDVLYIPIPFYHSNALMVAWSSAAASGAAMAIRRKFSTSQFWSDVREFNASAFIYIGEICRYLYNQPVLSGDEANGIRKIIGNGLRPEIWTEFKQRFGIKKALEFYGSADGNIAFTNTFNLDCTVGWTPAVYAVVQYDFEIEAPIRDFNGFFKKVKKGEDGLLISNISRKTPLSGYVRFRQNEKKILRNVFKKGDAWFNTGDIMRDIGFRHLQFVDRIGDTFRWKGENVSTTEVEKIINQYPGIIMSTVYGVHLPNTDGRAGMVALTVENPWTKPQLDQFYLYLKEQLPSYAVPLLVRFCKKLEITATQKIKKINLKKEGFDIGVISDSVYIKLPLMEFYTMVDFKIYSSIKNNDYQF